MPKVGFFLRDDTIPRTEYWQELSDAIGRSPSHRVIGAEVLIPAEDMAMETQWPRYGRQRSAYLRGEGHDMSPGGPVMRYFQRICRAAREAPKKPLLYINMDPFFRVSRQVRALENVIVADVSLTDEERAENPRTISMPALPIVRGNQPGNGPRAILASFQGANSDPVRMALRAVADGTSFVVNLIDHGDYIGKVDSVAGTGDPAYERLLAQSTFALVPRGDRHFSYRLLEAMSFGCIPVILSDGWVLPFDRIVPWSAAGLRVRRDEIAGLPARLAAIPAAEVAAMQASAFSAYRSHFADLGTIVAGLLTETDRVLGRHG